MPRGILKRPNGPLKLAPLYIRAVLTIPLTRTEKQGFKSQIGDNYKVNQLTELMRASAKDIFEYVTTFLTLNCFQIKHPLHCVKDHLGSIQAWYCRQENGETVTRCLGLVCQLLPAEVTEKKKFQITRKECNPS